MFNEEIEGGNIYGDVNDYFTICSYIIGCSLWIFRNTARSNYSYISNLSCLQIHKMVNWSVQEKVRIGASASFLFIKSRIEHAPL